MSDPSDYADEDAYELRRRVERDVSAGVFLTLNGAAVEQRVIRCVDEAERLLDAGFTGAAVTRATTAIELMLRYFITMPLMSAAIGYTGVAEMVLKRVLPSDPRGPKADRDFLPRLLREWDIEITHYKTPSGGQLWQQIVGSVIDARHRYVHQGDDIAPGEAHIAIASAKQLWDEVVIPLASRLGIDRGTTGDWSTLKDGSVIYMFQPKDPFSSKGPQS